MQRSIIAAFLAAGVVLLATPTFAEESKSSASSGASAHAERPFIPKEEWDKLSREEKDKIKAERRAAWQKMSPEEREAIKEKRRAERKERWESMTPEEREKFKAERRERGKEYYENASPEEKERIKARMEERRKQRDLRRDHQMQGGDHRAVPATPATPAAAPLP